MDALTAGKRLVLGISVVSETAKFTFGEPYLR